MEKIRSEVEQSLEEVEGICVDEIEKFQDFIDETYNMRRGLHPDLMALMSPDNQEMCKLAKKIIGMLFFAKELNTPRPSLDAMLHFGQLRARCKQIPLF